MARRQRQHRPDILAETQHLGLWPRDNQNESTHRKLGFMYSFTKKFNSAAKGADYHITQRMDGAERSVRAASACTNACNLQTEERADE